MRPSRTAVLAVPSVEVRTESQHSIHVSVIMTCCGEPCPPPPFRFLMEYGIDFRAILVYLCVTLHYHFELIHPFLPRCGHYAV